MEGFEAIGLRLDLVVLWWAAGVGLGLLVVFLVIAYFVGKHGRGYGPEFGWRVGAFISAVIGGAGALVLIIQLVPFNSAYHHWYSASGTVDSVTNIFEGGSGEISPGYVVELDSVDKPLLFDDPRILRAVGNDIEVTCSVAWVPAGVDRLNCWIAG